jgi:hypothetical protein
MQTIQKDRESKSLVNRETKGIMQFSSRGTAIKVGIITGGAIAAGIVMTYYLRKRQKSRS